ncbi:MAG: phosphate acyltransferase, partial [Lentisphaerota bacterium]
MSETVLEKIRGKAKSLNRKICLTESDDVRNLKAAEKLVATGYASPILVGAGNAIERLAKDNSISLKGIEVV